VADNDGRPVGESSGRSESVNNSRDHIDLSDVPDLRNLTDSQGFSYWDFRKTLTIKQTDIFKNMLLPWVMMFAPVCSCLLLVCN
jgi:hypothetical protein